MIQNMPTYRDLLDKLAALSHEQLDTEIKVIPLGYTEDIAKKMVTCESIPQILELSKVSRDIYYYSPSDTEDAEWIEPGLCDFSDDEVKELGIDQDEDYKLVCRKGEIIFKFKDNIMIVPEEAAKFGNLDTSILHL